MEDPTLSTNETNDEKYGAQLEAVTSIHHSAIVMGIVNSTGRPLTARLLPRYRDQMQRCRRTEQAAKEANPTSSQQPATVSGTFRGLSATCDKPYGKENATIDDDGRLVIRTYHRRSTTNNIQSCRFDSKPLLHQELECKIASTTGPLQEINALTEVSRCLHSDKWTQNDVHQPPTASPTAATSESDVVSSDCILVNNQRNENVSKSSARCHWRRLNGLVWSLERSDNTINRWNSVKHGVRDSRVMRQSNCSDDTKTSHGGHSSFELALMNGDSSPADRQVDAKLLEAIRMDEFEPNDSLGRHVDSNADSKADDVAVATRRQLRREQCVNCCRKFMAFLFSTVGSSFVLVGYVIMGGLTFRALEAENELNTKIDMQKVRLEHIHWLWNVTEEMNVLHPDAWCIEAERILASFSTRIYTATKIHGWDGKDGNSEQQWSYPGALLYSVTVITTIGYGHITPKTTAGQVVTMLYAIFGIPLTLFTITNLGAIMATSFRFLYKYICCGLCCVCCRCHRRHRKLHRHAEVKSTTNKSGKSSCLLTKPGIKRLELDGKNGNQWLHNAAQREDKHLKENFEDIDEVESFKQRVESVFTGSIDINKISVPIYVSLLLMTGYILLGATMFWLAEDWNFLVAAYFCFITLSTIGFGDYVPGNNFTASSTPQSVSLSPSTAIIFSTSSSIVTSPPATAGASLGTWRSQKLVVCALYLVCGLALIAMCFDLMQESAKNKFRRLGRRLGLLPETDRV